MSQIATLISEVKRYALVQPEEADGLVIHCSDPRFQAAFREFVTSDLGLQHPIPIVVPGGVHDLVSPARLKAARNLWEQVEFMVKEGHVRRIVPINHEDCKWYAKWNTLVQTTVGQDISGHLLALAEKLAEKKLGVEVECYLAKLEGDAVTFHRVDRD